MTEHEKRHAYAALAVVALAALACRGGARATYDAGAVVPSVEAAKLVPLLPPALGTFTAKAPATTLADAMGPRIEADRTYVDGARTASVRISTGDVRTDLATLDSDEEHAFGSDTPTYWRTTSIAGHRARVAEDRPVVHTSECIVRASPNHVVTLRVTPAASGDCERLAASLDWTKIAASGGVPSPPSERTR